jgi:hypothetical protein
MIAAIFPATISVPNNLAVGDRPRTEISKWALKFLQLSTICSQHLPVGNLSIAAACSLVTLTPILWPGPSSPLHFSVSRVLKSCFASYSMIPRRSAQSDYSRLSQHSIVDWQSCPADYLDSVLLHRAPTFLFFLFARRRHGLRAFLLHHSAPCHGFSGAASWLDNRGERNEGDCLGWSVFAGT